jgi:thermitase
MKKRIFTITFLAATAWLVFTTGSVQRTAAEKDRKIRLRPVPMFVSGRLLVKFNSNIGSDQARQVIAALGTRHVDEIPGIGVHIIELPYHAAEAAVADSFLERPEVEFAEFDRLLPLQQIVPNDPLYPSWFLQKINAPQAWSMSTGSSSVVIAILDTGVDATHPDLVSKIVPGRNIYNNNTDTTDINGHGTAVAGVAGASSNNGIGISSVAWNCLIMPVRISDPTGMASASSIASGLSWAADHGARVANISYYVTGIKTISSAARYFQGKGGVVVTAAGNYGVLESAPDDPYMLAVGATDPQDVLYTYSNRGNNLDLVAPGNNTTTLIGGQYGAGGGTSFASPVVAGVAALVLSVNQSQTAAEVTYILKQNADDLGAVGWDTTYGSGRVNAANAVSAALGSVGTADTVPPSVNITSPEMGQRVGGTTSVQVQATDNVRVARNELYVDGVLVATSATAPFTTKWNSRKATPGSHELQCRAYDAAGNSGLSSTLIIYK